MLPQRLFDAATRAVRGELQPNYLREYDYPWLRALLEERARFTGELRSSFTARLKDPLPLPAPKRKLRLAAYTLDRAERARQKFEVAPREIRRALFQTRAVDAAPRDELIATLAPSLTLEPDRIESLLFADLPAEQRLGAIDPPLSESELAARVNHDIVSSLVARAAHVEIRAWGNTHALIQSAELRGLICTVHPSPGPNGVRLEIFGPFALFRKTSVYGRALAALVPRVQLCDRFELSAKIPLDPERDDDHGIFKIKSGDPIQPTPQLADHQVDIETAFAREFARATQDWKLEHDPRPIGAGKTLIFPSFELVHRADPKRRFILEILGFWTDVYLRDKLERLAAAKITNVILCVDESRRCSEYALDVKPESARVISFRRRLDPRKVLAAVASEN